MEKMGRESNFSISPTVRGALNRMIPVRTGIAGCMFPSPKDSEEPITRHLAEKWLKGWGEACRVGAQAGEAVAWTRRKWSADGKNFPDVHVAAR